MEHFPSLPNTKFEDSTPNVGLTNDEIIRELYFGLFERSADGGGFESALAALGKGAPLSDIIRNMVASEEFASRNKTALAPSIVLPDLTRLYPTKYVRKGPDSAIFNASSDDDFKLMESLIVRNRYYDSFGVWAPKIDLDKRITAAIVAGLGAQSCLELGCFTGSVLSLLAEQGVEVCGVEVSHLAFLLAHANVHEKIRFGNLLDLPFDIFYDLFLGMDILEHLNPLDLGHYISRIAQLVKRDGFAYINSPMFGTDDVFARFSRLIFRNGSRRARTISGATCIATQKVGPCMAIWYGLVRGGGKTRF
jgi:2-polyprenyl-3-methyl-5-hydroxy-6-metoxy-1,4-benzoquinol methylase